MRYDGAERRLRDPSRLPVTSMARSEQSDPDPTIPRSSVPTGLGEHGVRSSHQRLRSRRGRRALRDLTTAAFFDDAFEAIIPAAP